MTIRLPPFSTLRLFEAAGRHLNFRMAAEELGVTPSAVSHAIHNLELSINKAVFVRSKRFVELTEAGEALLPAVAEFLSQIGYVSARIREGRSEATLRISVAPYFAKAFLVQRLRTFGDLFPNYALRMDTDPKHVDLVIGGADIAIRRGRGGWPNVVERLLLTEQLAPIFSPTLSGRLASKASIRTATKIHVTSTGEDWAFWAAATGISVAEGRHIYVDTIQDAVDAAKSGIGVALGRFPLVNPEIEAGKLSVGSWPVVTSSVGYWLLGLPATLDSVMARRFIDWLGEQLDAAVANTPKRREIAE